MTNRTKGIAAIVVSAFGFALMAMFVRLCDDYGHSVSSFQKSFFRNFVALVVAAVAFARNPRREISLPKGSALALLCLRATLGTVGIFANFYALSRISIAECQTLNKAAPFFTVLFAWLCLGETATRRQVLSLVVAFGGVLLIAKPGFAGSSAFPLSMAVLGGACAGGAYVCLRALRRHSVSPAFIILFFSAFSCLATIPFMIARFDPMTVAQVAILLGAGVGGAVGQFGVTLAYGYAAPRDIAVYDYSSILFAAAFGFLFFGQVPDLLSVFGVVAILGAAFHMSRQHMQGKTT